MFKEHRPHVNGFIGRRVTTYAAALTYRGLFALAVLALAAGTTFYRESGEVGPRGESMATTILGASTNLRSIGRLTLTECATVANTHGRAA